MASRFSQSCSATLSFLTPSKSMSALGVLSVLALPAFAQILLKPTQPGEAVILMPSDATILDAAQDRKDLPCTVTQRKAELGFDLRFHAGFDVSLPLNELVGEGQLLTVIFRVTPNDASAQSSNFVQRFTVPPIAENAKGEASLGGVIDLGEGAYRVDWLIRDHDERLCSTSWDVDANLSIKDKPIPLLLPKNRVEQTKAESFFNEPFNDVNRVKEDGLNVKLLVNFAPQNAISAALQRSDTDALVTILKSIERDPRVAHVSLVAFNINEGRVLYRQESGAEIDFPALGKALSQMKLGTVDIQKLSQKHSDTEFLQNLITTEVTPTAHADAVIFAGPKAMLDVNVPQDDLRRIGEIECPVFYMNYTLNPQATPWKDSISHAIRTFKGTEYTISRPREIWSSTMEMFSRIVRLKHERALTSLVTGGSK